MGYHLILNVKGEEINSIYIKELNELLAIENLSQEYIIYQGEENWKPFKLKEVTEYCNYTEDWFRAGLKAQDLFKQQASKEGFIVEELHQDPSSFKYYTCNADKLIKRGDFLIRNANNIEVDVKCKKFYGSYFYFSLDDLDKHLNMMKLVDSNVMIALYEKYKDCPVSESLRMIEVSQINQNRSSYQIKKDDDNNLGKALRIPLSDTISGFELLNMNRLKKQALNIVI